MTFNGALGNSYSLSEIFPMATLLIKRASRCRAVKLKQKIFKHDVDLLYIHAYPPNHLWLVIFMIIIKSFPWWGHLALSSNTNCYHPANILNMEAKKKRFSYGNLETIKNWISWLVNETVAYALFMHRWMEMKRGWFFNF